MEISEFLRVKLKNISSSSYELLKLKKLKSTN